MLAVHCNWTKPKIARTGEYSIRDFDIITAAASALYWKKKNGKIRLYTDENGLRYYDRLGLTSVYDEVDLGTIAEFEKHEIDPLTFFTGAKVFVIGKTEPPFVFLDNDFIVFDRIKEDKYALDLCFIHWELPNRPVYPDKESYILPEGYRFDPAWDFSMMVPNSALVYLGHKGFQAQYLDNALEFMIKYKYPAGSPYPADTYYLFTDQRLLGMIAKQAGIKIGTFSNPILCPGPEGDFMDGLEQGQRPFWLIDPNRFKIEKDRFCWFHTFFFKDLYAADHALKNSVFIPLLRKIGREFPDIATFLEKFDSVRPLLELASGPSTDSAPDKNAYIAGLSMEFYGHGE